MNDTIRMQISAFVDGELPDSEADLLLRRLGQDAELRQAAAEFLELGRVMRGEANVPGIERLRERIAAELDNRKADGGEVVADTAQRLPLKPLVGVAVAASVALVALFALQVTPGVDTTPAVETTTAGAVEDTSYTVPEPDDEQLRQYLRNHGALSSELGANGMNTRRVTLRTSEELLVEDEASEMEEDDAASDAADETPTQQP